MIIIRIRPRGKRIVVEFDEGAPLVIAQDVALKFILYTGKDLDEEQLHELQREQEFFDALTAAHRFIGYRARSEREVREKLRMKKISGEVIERTVALLRVNGTLNDADFSWKFVHDALLKKPVGRIRLKQELRRKGLDDEMIERVLNLEFTGEQEIDAAMKLARRRLARSASEPTFEQQQDAKQYLYSRGFSREAIEQAAGRLFAENN